MIRFLALLLFALVSCSSHRLKIDDVSTSVVPAVSPVSNKTNDRFGSVLVTAEFVSCPLGLACNYLSSLSSGVSISCNADYASKLVTLKCSSQPLAECLVLLARSVSLDVIPYDSGFFVGSATENDNVLITGTVTGYSQSELDSILKSSLSGCFVSVAPDGYCVVSCPVSSVSRVRNALDSLKKSRPLYKVRLVVVSDWFDSDIVDGSFSISGSRSVLLRDWFWSKLFMGNFDISIGNSLLKSNIYQIHDFCVVDGDDLYIYRGTKQPIPRHTISDSGTNSISGYDVLNIGDTIKLRCNTQVDSSILCSVNHESSSAVGFVGDYPVSDTSELKTTVRLNQGDIYCIGDFDYNESRFGWLRFLMKKKRVKLLLSVVRLDS